MAHSVLCASLREKIPDVLCLLSAWDSGGGQVSLPVFRGALAALGLVASPLAVARFFAAIGMHARPQRPSGVISLNELEAALQETTFQPPSPRSAPYFGTSLNVAGASWESATQRREMRRGGAHTGGGVASHGGRPQSAGRRALPAGSVARNQRPASTFHPAGPGSSRGSTVPWLEVVGTSPPGRPFGVSCSPRRNATDSEFFFHTALRVRSPRLTNHAARPGSAPQPQPQPQPQPPQSPQPQPSPRPTRSPQPCRLGPFDVSQAAAALQRSALGGSPHPDRAGNYSTGVLDSSLLQRPTCKARGLCAPSAPVVGFSSRGAGG